MSDEKRFTPKEAAHYLGPGCSASSLAKLRCTGDGPVYYQVRRRVFYLQSDLDEYLRRGRRQQTPGADKRAPSSAEEKSAK